MCHNSNRPLPPVCRCAGGALQVKFQKDRDRVPARALVLLILSGRYQELEDALHAAGYTVVVPPTPDQAVAVSLHNEIAATLIDASSFADSADWSLARSLKAVSPS